MRDFRCRKMRSGAQRAGKESHTGSWEKVRKENVCRAALQFLVEKQLTKPLPCHFIDPLRLRSLEPLRRRHRRVKRTVADTSQNRQTPVAIVGGDRVELAVGIDVGEGYAI